MILAPMEQDCSLCGGVMHLMWASKSNIWHYVIVTPPKYDNIQLVAKCESCGSTGDPYGTNDADRMEFNKLRYKIISAMIKGGLYSWRTEI